MSYLANDFIFSMQCHIWQAMSYLASVVIFSMRCNISSSLNVCQIFASLKEYFSVAECVSNFHFAQYFSVAECVSNFRFAQAIFERRYERVSNYWTSDIKIIKSKKLQHGHFSGVGTGIFHISSQGENLQVKTIFSQWECRIMALDQLTVL